ncbi:hypothetical protein H0H92_001705, partial [Tricholoma furcatifolium]
MAQLVPFEVRIYHPVTGAVMESGLTFEAPSTVGAVEAVHQTVTTHDVSTETDAGSHVEFETEDTLSKSMKLQSSQKKTQPRKRVRRKKYTADDPRNFLDVEAEVSDASEDDEDEEGLDTFINDIESESDEEHRRPPPAEEDDDKSLGSDWTDDEYLDFTEPTTASHAAVMQLMTVDEANEAFRSYLELEERRKAPHSAPIAEQIPIDKIPDGIVHLLPRPDFDKFLWRVSVRRGREESLAFILYRKAILGNFQVQSIIGRVSCPGWVYVEATEYAHVQKLCQDVRDVHMHQIFRIPPPEAPSILREPPYVHPPKGSWVRLTHHKVYHGDLGWVSDHIRRMTIERKRRDRDEPLHLGSARSLRNVERPPQRVLDMKPMMETGCPGVTDLQVWSHRLESLPDHWAEPVERVPTNELDQYTVQGHIVVTTCSFYGRELCNGFHVITTRHYEPTIPSVDELQIFKSLKLIKPTLITFTEELLSMLRVQVDDPIKITAGQAHGAVGRVVHVQQEASIASVELADGVVVDIALKDLRKLLTVGDEVCVVEGLHVGFTGWVVCIEDGKVHLFDDRTGEAIIVAAHQVIFYEAPKTVYTRTQRDLSQAPAGFHFSNLRSEDIVPALPVRLPHVALQNPHQRFVGREVQVIDGPFKDYHGLVKNTERGDILNVELGATLQQRQFTLKQLAHRYDPRLRALTTYADLSVYLPTFSPPLSTTTDNTWSSMPLVPSTPLPEDTSVALARAWNPSSRTPIPGSGFPCNHYMDSERLNTDLRVRVRVAGTKPILQDPGWKAGDWEGKPGL